MKSVKTLVATREEIETVIRNTKGKLFSVEFIKKDGSKRKMCGRTQVTAHLKGGVSTIKDHKNLISMYEFQRFQQGYKCFNMDTLISAKVGGVVYMVSK